MQPSDRALFLNEERCAQAEQPERSSKKPSRDGSYTSRRAQHLHTSACHEPVPPAPRHAAYPSISPRRPTTQGLALRPAAPGRLSPPSPVGRGPSRSGRHVPAGCSGSVPEQSTQLLRS